MMLAPPLRSEFMPDDKEDFREAGALPFRLRLARRMRGDFMIENLFDAVWVVVLGIVTLVVFKLLF